MKINSKDTSLYQCLLSQRKTEFLSGYTVALKYRFVTEVEMWPCRIVIVHPEQLLAMSNYLLRVSKEWYFLVVT